MSNATNGTASNIQNRMSQEKFRANVLVIITVIGNHTCDVDRIVNLGYVNHEWHQVENAIDSADNLARRAEIIADKPHT